MALENVIVHILRLIDPDNSYFLDFLAAEVFVIGNRNSVHCN